MRSALLPFTILASTAIGFLGTYCVTHADGFKDVPALGALADVPAAAPKPTWRIESEPDGSRPVLIAENGERRSLRSFRWLAIDRASSKLPHYVKLQEGAFPCIVTHDGSNVETWRVSDGEGVGCSLLLHPLDMPCK